MLRNAATEALQRFASENKETQGKFTIADEKVSFFFFFDDFSILFLFFLRRPQKTDFFFVLQEHNVFMRVTVSVATSLCLLLLLLPRMGREGD